MKLQAWVLKQKNSGFACAKIWGFEIARPKTQGLIQYNVWFIIQNSNYACIANQSEEQIAAAFLHIIFTILNLQFKTLMVCIEMAQPVKNAIPTFANNPK